MDLWDEWDRDLRSAGNRPDRLAQELTDEELVNLLTAQPDTFAAANAARALKQEALRRLHNARRPDRPAGP